MKPAIFVLALLVCVSLLAQPAQMAAPHPAKDVRYLVYDSTARDTIEGTVYDKGLVWVPSVADTVQLKEFGFVVLPMREICRDSSGKSAGLDVLWPDTLNLDSLPAFIEHLILGAKCR